MTHPTYLICGFGRCGSSMVMQMLHAGGIQCVGDWPDFEAPGIETVAAMLRGGPLALNGAAVKILDATSRHDFDLPKRGTGYRALWLDRNPDQQARSACKFMAATNSFPPGNRQHQRALRAQLAKSYTDDRAMCITRLHRICGQQPLILSFENILRDPARIASKLAAWTGRQLDERRMAQQVVPRTPNCLPGMLELAQLFDRRAAQGGAA